VQYTGGWEDYVMLALCSVLGILAKKFKFSRAALLVSFILAERVENLTIQLVSLYNIETLITRPIFVIVILASVALLLYGVLNKNKLEYS